MEDLVEAHVLCSRRSSHPDAQEVRQEVERKTPLAMVRRAVVAHLGLEVTGKQCPGWTEIPVGDYHWSAGVLGR